eukprot:CAMPEP_0117443418 /NCGR_PEP_ID=MMETSP0759-20121206/4684_1 /TAXON_ID=63605 /ORGANISM="Percolomonas cosmopolitus, Strain WS" /LENGTH=887 /DNA_ID=CAMNT_0005235391 /DNA_START=247 /DNA_END=2907 /DNA_ORIENTATION=+
MSSETDTASSTMPVDLSNALKEKVKKTDLSGMYLSEYKPTTTIPKFQEDSIDAKYIADFTPRSLEVDPNREDGDDPRLGFDNNPSKIFFDNYGKFNNPKEMAALINGANKEIKTNPFDNLGLLLAATGVYPILRKRIIEEGYFMVVNRGVKREIRLPGIHILLPLFASWGEKYPLDDEEHHKLTIGNSTILRVRSNCLGVAHMVGDSKQGFALDSDLILFSQGSYVLDESCFRDIHVGQLDPKQSVMTIGSLRVLQIAEGYVGGARNRQTNRYHIFTSGAPLLLDSKEWADVECVKRTKDMFSVGPITFITCSEGEIVCIGHKSGYYRLITTPNTYTFHTAEWESFEKAPFTASLDIGVYYIRTISEEEVAEVKDLDGNYHVLPQGRYKLSKKEFHEPLIVKLDKPLMELLSCHVLRVQSDYLSGAWNVQTGEFDVFDEENAVLRLSKRTYPVIERIPRVHFEAQPFGPFKVITIQNGFYGLFEESGNLTVSKPGTFVLDNRTIIREALTSRPVQLVLNDLEFSTRERFGMSASAVVMMVLDHPEHVSNELQSNRENFSTFKMRLADYAKRLLGKFFKEYSLSQLVSTDEGSQDDINQNYAQIMQNFSDALTDYSVTSSLGIKFTSSKLTGDIKIADLETAANFSAIEKSRLAARSAQESGKAQLEEARARSTVALEESKRQKSVRVMDQQAVSEAKKIEMETEAEIQVSRARTGARSDAEARELMLEIETKERSKRAEALAEERRVAAEAEARDVEIRAKSKASEEKLLADSHAYRVRLEAEAKADAKRKENEIAQQMPDTLVHLKEKELQVRAIEALAQGKLYPDITTELIVNALPFLKIGGNGQMLNAMVEKTMDKNPTQNQEMYQKFYKNKVGEPDTDAVSHE